MRKMSHLEQRELQCSEIELSELVKKIEAEAAMLSKKESKLCKVERVQEQNIVKVEDVYKRQEQMRCNLYGIS